MGGKVDYEPEPPRGGDSDAPANCEGALARVTILGAASFSPSSITINKGQAVCWTWGGSSQHSVAADDGSFSSGTPDTFGTFQRTFTAAGTFGYYCKVHGTPTVGMRGSVTVLDTSEPPGSGPGTLGFAPEAYTAEENAGVLTVAVARTGGSDGTASLNFATANGTARSGKDFTPRKGTLTWPAGDQDPRTVEVPIKNDGGKEADETFTIKLTKAAGSALGAAVATVTIHDDDSPPCTAALSAPARLAASGISESDVRLDWSVEAAAAHSIRVERRLAGGDFHEVATLPADARSFTDAALPRGATFHYRLRLAGEGGFSAYSPIAAAATDGAVGACSESEASVCLGGGRFEARVEGRRADTKASGVRRVLLPGTSETAVFAVGAREAESAVIADSAHGEPRILVAVHDGCAVNERYWLDLAILTDAELTLTVRDTLTGRTWVLYAPAGSAPRSVRDAEAFATCP